MSKSLRSALTNVFLFEVNFCKYIDMYFFRFHPKIPKSKVSEPEKPYDVENIVGWIRILYHRVENFEKWSTVLSHSAKKFVRWITTLSHSVEKFVRWIPILSLSVDNFATRITILSHTAEKCVKWIKILPHSSVQRGRTKQPILNETKPPISETGQNRQFEKWDKTANFKMRQNRRF